jgi:hypothetical protein
MSGSTRAAASAAVKQKGPLSPLAFLLEHLFPKRGVAPYTTSERVVVLVIVRAMSFDPAANAFNCFLSYPTIVRWSGISLASVKRVLRRHANGPAPLLALSRPGQTRGYRHSCYRFTLVQAPDRFVVGRDRARAAYQREVEEHLRDLQPERIALQRQRWDFGGTLTHDDYQQRLAALEDAVRRKRPARAGVRRPPP